MKHLIQGARFILAGILWILATTLCLFAQTPVGTEIVNIAIAQYRDGGGFIYSIQSQPVITTISQGYWLTISKSVERTVFLPLDTVKYHISLVNSGNLAASSITVTDTLSDDLIYVSSQPSATVNGRTVSWNLSALQPGATFEIILIGIIAPGVSSGTTIVNSAGFRTPENVTGNSTGIEITIGSLPDLVLKKVVNRLTAAVGDTLIYTITVQNIGNAASTETILYDDLPDQTEYVVCSGTGQYVLGIIAWNIDVLSPGSTVEETVTTVVKNGISPGTTVINTVSVLNSEGIDRSASAMTLITEEIRHPDLWIEKKTNISATPGDTLNYHIVFGNRGNGAGTGIVISDSLSPDLEFLNASGLPQYEPLTHRIVWNLSNLNSGGQDSVDLFVRIRTGIVDGTQVQNTAKIVCTEGSTTTFSAVVTILSPVLSITKHAASAVVSAGHELKYTIAYQNTGNGPARNVLITDTLSADFDYVSSTGLSQFDSQKRIFTWNIGTLPARMSAPQSVDLTIQIKSPLSNGTILPNSASIACQEGFSTRASVNITVQSEPILTLTKTTKNQAAPGDTLIYNIVFRNSGSAVASQTAITDTLSDNLEYLSSSGTSAYSAQNRIVVWNIGTLPVDLNSTDSVELRVRLKSPLDNGIMISNSAHITCTEGCTGKASVNTTVVSAAIITLTKTTKSQAAPGDTLIYNIAYLNSGNAIARQANIIDTLSALVEFINASGVYTYDNSEHLVKWEVGELSPGVNDHVSLTVRIKASLTGSFELTNTAWLHSPGNIFRTDIAKTDVTSLNLFITVDPDSIIGNGVNYSDISATVTDASGHPAPDGTVVVFSASLGSFSPGTDTVLTTNGIARTRLYSCLINQEYVPVEVKAKLLYPPGNMVSDSTSVVFYSVTIIGVVTYSNKDPIPGAIVTLLQNGVVIGMDTTSATGEYRIPIFNSGQYVVIIQYTDRFGNARTIEQVIEITITSSGQTGSIADKCVIAGRIIDEISQQPIRETDISIIIRAVTPSSLGKATQTVFSDTAYSDTTVTDTSGFWSFSNLDLGTYSIETIYHGTGNYHSGIRLIVLDTPGQLIMDADITQRQIPFRTYKSVNKTYGLTGDTLSYRIYYQTLDHAVTDTFRIVDQLPSELDWIPTTLIHTPELILDGFDAILSELRFHQYGMPANQTDSIIFKAQVKTDISPGVFTITNQATIFSPSDTIQTADDIRSNATTRIISPFLAVKKVVNRRVIETGDILTYIVTLENRSSDVPVSNLVITDILPRGFRYREKRSVWNGKLITDPVVTIPGKRQNLIWTMADTLFPGKFCELKYRIITGLDSRFGENENLVSATATLSDGLLVSSNIAKAEVILKPGMIQERGFIFGKVFYDTNGNNLHDQNEETVKGVEIVTQEGTRVVTDQYGKYSIPNVRSGDHVLRINLKTLPDSATVRLSSFDFLGDSSSRLVKMTPVGIAKANFILQKPTIVVKPNVIPVTGFNIIILGDSLSKAGDWIISPGDTAHAHVILRFANPLHGDTIRVTASLSADLYFPAALTDSLKQIQTWKLPVESDRSDFQLDMEIGSIPSMQKDQVIHVHVEILDEKMTVEGILDETFTVGVKHP